MRRITIITVNYNNRNGLERTIRSVLRQDCPNMEYLVIDGASTDGSVNVIQQYAKEITLWLSEPDTGIYHAMNKGISMATGEYLLFMNSGDCFSSDNVLNSFCNNQRSADLIIGRQHYIRNGKKSICRKTYAEEVDEQFLISNTLPHQATFIKRELIQKVGGYRLDFKIVADWIFWYEAVVNHKAKVENVNFFIADMEEENTSKNMDKCRSEMAKYLMEKKKLNITDWKKIIEENNQAYMYRRAVKTPFSKLLVKIALRLNK